MLTLYDMRDYDLGPSVVCMGKFDGVHVGHVKLLRESVRLARELNAKSVALTFDKSPLSVLHPNAAPDVLTQDCRKRELIENIGLDVLIVVPFTQEFAALSANDYLHLLCNHLRPLAVVSGEDFHFGKGALGDPALIEALSGALGYRAVVVELERQDGHVVSSTAVREAIKHGERDAAERMLGRPID